MGIFSLLGGGSGGGGGFTMIIMLVLLFGVMYFLMIRPQKKEQKRMQEMLSKMEVGDAVMTTSGFYGIIIDISEDDVIVEFGNNQNCRIPLKKAAITTVEKPGQALEGPAEPQPKRRFFFGGGAAQPKGEEKAADKAAESAEKSEKKD